MKLVHESPHKTFKVHRLSNSVYLCTENDDIKCCYVGLIAFENRESLIGLMANNNIGFSGIEVRKPVKRVSDRFKWEAKINGISRESVFKLAELNNKYNKERFPETYSQMSHLWE